MAPLAWLLDRSPPRPGYRAASHERLAAKRRPERERAARKRGRGREPAPSFSFRRRTCRGCRRALPSRHAIDWRSVRLRGAFSVAPSHSKVWSRAARYQIHRMKGSREKGRPCRKAREFAKAQRARRVFFPFFFPSSTQFPCSRSLSFFLPLFFHPSCTRKRTKVVRTSQVLDNGRHGDDEIDQIAEEKRNQKAR